MNSLNLNAAEAAPCERCGLINGHRHPCTTPTFAESVTSEYLTRWEEEIPGEISGVVEYMLDEGDLKDTMPIEEAVELASCFVSRPS